MHVSTVFALLVAHTLGLACADDDPFVASTAHGDLLISAGRVAVTGGLYVNNAAVLTESALTNRLAAIEARVAALETPPEPDATHFISTWTTDNTGASDSRSIQLPLHANGTYDFDVDFGDGSPVVRVTHFNQSLHIFPSPNSYTIRINGTIEGWRFSSGGDRLKLISVDQWGPLRLGDGGEHFWGCFFMRILATDRLNLAGVTTLYRSFKHTGIGVEGNLNAWDVSQVQRTPPLMCSSDRLCTTFLDYFARGDL